MLFNSIEYGVLLLCAFTGLWLLARIENRLFRNLFLLFVSYFFYACWNVRYLSLIFISSSLDFGIGRALHHSSNPATRKWLLAVSVTVNLGILCVFKYFNFFVDSFAALLTTCGLQVDPAHLNVLLPVGISFYTFQTLSYTIDVYRRKLTPITNYLDYLLFVSFFPQLVAGPIVRASHLLPQLGGRPSLTSQEGSRALLLIGLGLVKKIAIADFLGAHLVDPVFSNPQMYSSIEALTAVYGYAFQIYADFSAYSDIAIGSASLLGFKIPINFNAPYTASNLREFWQRWHISLSTWLRDYLYIPLGGSRRGHAHTCLALMATMLLGGLWHGAALTFVFWGLIHGLALVLTRVIQRTGILNSIGVGVRRGVGIFITFHVVCAAWIFFRSSSFDKAFEIFEALAAMDFGWANLTLPILLVLSAAFATHWIPGRAMERMHMVFPRIPAPLQAASLVTAIIAVRQMALTDVTPFIYFQF